MYATIYMINMGLIWGPTMKIAFFWPKNVKEGGEIVFPSGVRITFVGYANGNKIMGKVVKGNVMISALTDEMINAKEKKY